MHPRDLSPVRRVLRFAGAVLLAAVVAAPVYAQALDTPTVQQVGGGFFRMDFDVTAGASGAPHGFVIQWMTKSEYDEYGWPSSEYDPSSGYCDFTGEPTLNMDARSSSFRLGSGGVIEVQMGDLFDETGTYGSYLDQLPPGTYAVRVWAEGDGVNPNSSSLPSETQFFSTIGNPECTQGFWKTHPELWPVGCTPMMLGTTAYTAAQLLAIYNTPAAGNGLISLAHQLITVKLNACNGSDVSGIAGDIAAADALINGLVIPPVGAGYIHPSQTSALTQTFDDYNNGVTPGVVACVTQSKKSTWSKVKSIYR